jgi:hypothetical protein
MIAVVRKVRDEELVNVRCWTLAGFSGPFVHWARMEIALLVVGWHAGEHGVARRHDSSAPSRVARGNAVRSMSLVGGSTGYRVILQDRAMQGRVLSDGKNEGEIV